MQDSDSRKPVEIGQLLTSVFANKQWLSKLELHKVFEIWDRTVGREIGAVAQPSLIRGRVLWVRVADSVWMQQLHLQKILLLEKINDQLQNDKLNDIHFQLDSSLAVPLKKEKKTPKPVFLDKKAEQEFDSLISSLENGDLRASLKSLWLKIHTKRLKAED